MGRQIQVAMTRADEILFLDYLRSTADIQLIESCAPTLAQLWVSDLSPELKGHWGYSIWNRAFAWTPEYGQIGSKAYDPRCIGWYYVNISVAPVLEFSRSDVAACRFGRLYWARDFSAPYGLDYDEAGFSRWVDGIWRWVRKYGRKAMAGDPGAPYLLPDAYQVRGRA